MSAKASAVVPVVSTADGTLVTGQAHVHWITVSNIHATATAAIELDDGGTDRWAVTLDAVDGATGAIHCVFDPPIKFETNVIIDITGGTVVATVGMS